MTFNITKNVIESVNATIQEYQLNSNNINDVVVGISNNDDQFQLQTNLQNQVVNSQHHQQPSWFSTGRVQIPLYTTILLLAITGNALVILTLVQNRRMRTITNVFLLNLAVSDILLGVLCMPITLIGTLLRDFVFGGVMCKLLPYLQASSVSVSAWTLVAISCERYYAICHPLSSRRWQTLSHAYKLIALIWFLSFLLMSPIAALSRLIPTSQGHRKCREYWPDYVKEFERTFNIFLDFVLLVIPLVMLGATYSLITRTLWQGMRSEKAFKNQLTFDSNTQSSNNLVEVYLNSHGTTSSRCPSSGCHHQTKESAGSGSAGGGGGGDIGGGGTGGGRGPPHWCSIQLRAMVSNNGNSYPNSQESSSIATASSKLHSPGLRRTNAEKSLQNKKRVIKMLFVVVLEFFICWTPLYVINTVALFNPALVYQTLGYPSISFCQLLAYSSSCCNPITYCFMNRGFRKAFLNLFRCFKKLHEPRRISIGGYAPPGTQISETDMNRLQQTSQRQQTEMLSVLSPAELSEVMELATLYNVSLQKSSKTNHHLLNNILPN